MASAEDRAKARQVERQRAIWEAARQGSKIAKKMTVIQGGKKDKKK